MSSKFLKLKQVKAYFNISTATVNRWVKAGKLPQPHYVNQQRYWSVEDIECSANKLMRKI